MNNQKLDISMDKTEEDASFLYILTIIGNSKILIIGLSLAITLLALIQSLIMDPVFTGRTVLIPPQQQQNMSSGALASLSPMGMLGLKSQDDMYISFMTSESFQTIIIDRFNLHERYHADLLIDVRQALNTHVRLFSDKKSSLMTIEVDDNDPVFAANMANGYVQELGLFLGKLAITEAQQRQLYFEKQIKKTQDDLVKAESNFRENQSKSGLQIPSTVADLGIKEIAELHGQIRVRELQLQAINSFATPQNTEVKKLMTELSSMRNHLTKLEQGTRTVEPQNYLQQAALLAYRNMKVQESILESLVKQLEYAKVDVSKEAPLIQVVDTASIPERRTSPKRKIMVVTGGGVGLIIGIILAIIINMFKKIKETSEGREVLNTLIKAWSFKKLL